MKYQVYIFDWDGTLVDSERHIVASIERAARAVGLPVLAYDQMKNIIGLGMREALLTLYPDLNDSQVGDLRKHYSKHFFSESVEQGQLFGGVIDVLDTLKSKGLNLAVATGKSRNGFEIALDSTDLRSYFDIGRCADETKSKPHPMMLEQIIEFYASSGQITVEQMVMVGDTEFDLEMASLCGLDSIGVSYGVHDVERLLKHKPVKIIDHFSELLTI